MDDLFTLGVPGGVLVTSPLRSVAAFVNEAAAAALLRGESHPELRDIEEALAAPAAAPPRRSGPLAPAFLGIIPTRNCNLACVYCGFGAVTAPARRMGVGTAVAAVDWMAETVRVNGGKTLEVHFFGGEPLVAGDVIDAAVHRARIVAARLDLIPRFEISTNGVCSESRARFLGDYFDAVVLSFDGPREIHDRNRGSFDAVARTARILSDSSTELCFRTCVTNESVGALEESVRWFCETFRPNVVNVETLQPTAQSDAAGLAPPDPYAFAERCIAAMRIARAHGVEMTYSAAETDQTRNTFCPVGRDTVIVSPDGTMSGCYLLPSDWQRRGLDLDIGRIDDDGRVTIDAGAIERLRSLVAEKPPRCADCFCRYWCAGGCHVNPPSEAFCIQTRLITAHTLLEACRAA